MSFSLIRQEPDFRRLWLAQFLAFIGEGIFQIGLVWWVIKKTGSGTLVGLIMSASFLPAVFVGPFAGTFADRLPPKWLLIGADLFRAGLILIFAALAASDQLVVWHLFLLCGLLSAAGVFHSPTTLTVIPRVVPAGKLEEAMALHTIVRDLAKLVGPAVGGTIMAFSSVALAFSVHAAALVTSAVLISGIRLSGGQAEEVKESIFTQLREGIRYVRGHAVLLEMLLGFSVLNVFVVPIVVLLPLTVARVLSRGSVELGLSEGALALGSVVTGLMFSRLFATIPTSKLVIRSLALSGILFIAFAINIWFLTFLFGLFLLGGCFTSVNVAMMTMFQMIVAPEMKGRFFSLVETLSFAFFPFAVAAAGFLADAIGIPVTYGICAAGILILTMRFAFIPNLSNIDRKDS
ncbi:MAG: MFS transporter [Candidatus Riflebacteria bacterium]|nr:MFS transporter [Candidatus Riflebacteria bacterium]